MTEEPTLDRENQIVAVRLERLIWKTIFLDSDPDFTPEFGLGINVRGYPEVFGRDTTSWDWTRVENGIKQLAGEWDRLIDGDLGNKGSIPIIVLLRKPRVSSVPVRRDTDEGVMFLGEPEEEYQAVGLYLRKDDNGSTLYDPDSNIEFTRGDFDLLARNSEQESSLSVYRCEFPLEIDT